MLRKLVNKIKSLIVKNDTHVFSGEAEYVSDDGGYSQGEMVEFNAIVPVSNLENAESLLFSAMFERGWDNVHLTKVACSLYMGIEEKRKVLTSDVKVIHYPQ